MYYSWVVDKVWWSITQTLNVNTHANKYCTIFRLLTERVVYVLHIAFASLLLHSSFMIELIVLVSLLAHFDCCICRWKKLWYSFTFVESSGCDMPCMQLHHGICVACCMVLAHIQSNATALTLNLCTNRVIVCVEMILLHVRVVV